ncbi:MAG: hypothetical protein AUJ01_10005 [Acidobacteria bacterium 13_1_40CM_3_65_5]|nr:MAG: hypothetical protein AUJ01_10005 [Acidobacteria bacterium 13_1_40CM_3_65_5]
MVATLVANPVSVDTSKSYALVPLVATALATTSVTGWSTFLICALAAGETACGTVTDPVTASASAGAAVEVGFVGELLLQAATSRHRAIEPGIQSSCIRIVARKSTGTAR